MTLFANTKKQLLSEHLFAIGVLASELVKSQYGDKAEAEKEHLSKIAYYAGCLHDIGKVEPNFQEFTSSGKTEYDLLTGEQITQEISEKDSSRNGGAHHSYPRHNEVSVAIINSCFRFGNNEDKKIVSHTALWHHAKHHPNYQTPTPEELIELMGGANSTKLDSISVMVCQLLDEIAELETAYAYCQPQQLHSCFESENEINDDFKMPRFKSYSSPSRNYDIQNPSQLVRDIKRNAKCNVVRQAVITADRIISALSAESLHEVVEANKITSLLPGTGANNISKALERYITSFGDSSRSKGQAIIAEKLASTKVEVGDPIVKGLQGTTGSGKTKTSLHWALLSVASKVMWICPTQQTCENIYRDLNCHKELRPLAIQLIHGSRHCISKNNIETECQLDDKKFQGDIVITTVDQVIDATTTHNGIDNLYYFLSSHVVFDEYHEYINQPGILHSFCELVHSKMTLHKNDLLLVSATHHHWLLNDIFNTNIEYIEKLPVTNDCKFKLSLKEKHDQTPLALAKSNTIAFYNTVRGAQLDYIDSKYKKTELLMHASFTPEDRINLAERAIESYGEDGSHDIDVMRTTSIFQISANISCQHLITERCSAQDMLQRFGRCNRFSEHDNNKATLTILAPSSDRPEESGNLRPYTNKTLANRGEAESAYAWFCQIKALLDGKKSKSVTLEHLYAEYDEFFQQKKNIIRGELKDAFVASHNVFDGVQFEPAKFTWKEPDKRNGVKANSLRGDSVFVNPAVYSLDRLNSKNSALTNDYTDSPVTLALDIIKPLGLDESTLPIAKFIKAYKYVTGEKLRGKSLQKTVIGKARNKHFPVYTSFTAEDLNQENVENSDHSILYVTSDQPIGFMKNKYLNTPQ